MILPATALTIAGSDPSGGAGLQADLKTFQQFGVHGMSAVTLITVQNTVGVSRVEMLPVDLVVEQIGSVVDDIPPRAIKTGALGSQEMVAAVAGALGAIDVPIVVDPVLVSKHGDPLAGEATVAAYRELLLPIATLITPNRFEAEQLVGHAIRSESDAIEALDRMTEQGASAILLKLGSPTASDSRPSESVHWLRINGRDRTLVRPRLATDQVHGSGCVLAASIAALMARGETDLSRVVDQSVDAVLHAIATDNQLGEGLSPVETRAIAAIDGTGVTSTVEPGHASSIRRANTILYTDRLDELRAFYERLLGRKAVQQRDWFVELELGPNSFLSLADRARTSVDRETTGLTLSIEVDQVGSWRQILAERGVDVPPIVRTWGCRSFLVTDPAGNRIEFWSRSEGPNFVA